MPRRRRKRITIYYAGTELGWLHGLDDATAEAVMKMLGHSARFAARRGYLDTLSPNGPFDDGDTGEPRYEMVPEEMGKYGKVDAS